MHSSETLTARMIRPSFWKFLTLLPGHPILNLNHEGSFSYCLSWTDSQCSINLLFSLAMEQRTLVMALSLRFYKIPCCLLHHLKFNYIPNGSHISSTFWFFDILWHSLTFFVFKVLGMSTYKHLKSRVKQVPGRWQDAGSGCVWQMLQVSEHKKFIDSNQGWGAVSVGCILELWKGCFGLSITGRFYWHMLDLLQC